MQEKTDVVDEIPMRWLERGEGTPVVFVHGIPTSAELWRHVLPRVRNGRCLAWEMPGYGASIPAGNDRDISVARQADYLSAWLDHLDIERAVLVGHDLGGGVVQIFAAQHPDRAAGMVLTNAIGYDSWPIPSVQAIQRTAPALRWFPDVVMYPQFVAMLRRGHDNARIAGESIGLHWRHYATHGAARSMARQASALAVQDTLAVVDRLPQLDLPSRVIWGASDVFQKVEYGERFARDLGTTLQRIEGGRHFTPEDHPEPIATAVDELTG
ncbi:alpha/beta fold hydrolase [Haloactinomyces albus]|uniref:Pimeloyl-ACP methyl ester carboxylesterase n=1 Tax=Haloactinomyces albus TaxID=1352928 RepID=A0AAE4CNP7_9ACTN|nr:alpha/beta fold hydrolase [Haloactinomyces albus]MDR7302262.1 pimeloyl-ACP methyl ester carboxylesterase [Haloactinomyces albus]